MSATAAAGFAPLGLASICGLDRSLREVAEMAAAAGLDGLEVTARPPHLGAEAGPREAREAARAVRVAGLRVLCHGSYLGLGERRALRHAHADVAIAEALEAPLLRVWAEDTGAADEQDLLALLRATCDAAAGSGIQVVVERHVRSLADRPERVEQLLAAVGRENFGLNYQVLDALAPEAVSLQPADAGRLAGGARYFHVKNYRPGTAADPRLRLGASLDGGALDYAAILGAAWHAGYRGPLTLEFVAFDARPLEERVAEDAATLRRLIGAAAPAR